MGELRALGGGRDLRARAARRSAASQYERARRRRLGGRERLARDAAKRFPRVLRGGERAAGCVSANPRQRDTAVGARRLDPAPRCARGHRPRRRRAMPAPAARRRQRVVRRPRRGARARRCARERSRTASALSCSKPCTCCTRISSSPRCRRPTTRASSAPRCARGLWGCSTASASAPGRGAWFHDHYSRDLGAPSAPPTPPGRARADGDVDIAPTEAADAWSAAFDGGVPDVHAWILSLVQFGRGLLFPQLPPPPHGAEPSCTLTRKLCAFFTILADEGGGAAEGVSRGEATRQRLQQLVLSMVASALGSRICARSRPALLSRSSTRSSAAARSRSRRSPMRAMAAPTATCGRKRRSS